jgi:uncharacterized protein YjbJ (UPF0337 family)
MGSEEIHNKAEEWKGVAKETLGDVTDNKDLEAEGAAEKQKARVEQALADARDKVLGAAELAKDKVRETFGE